MFDQNRYNYCTQMHRQISKSRQQQIKKTIQQTSTNIDNLKVILSLQQEKCQNLQKQIQKVQQTKKLSQVKQQQHKRFLDLKVSKINSLLQLKQSLQKNIRQLKNDSKDLDKTQAELRHKIQDLQHQKNNDSYRQDIFESRRLELEQYIQKATNKLQRLNIQCYNLQNKNQTEQANQAKKYKQSETLREQVANKDVHINVLKSYQQELRRKINEAKNKLVIHVRLDNEEQIQFSVQDYKTGRQLKQLVYDKYDQLQPKLMVLLQDQVPIDLERKLSHISKQRKVYLRLRKAEVWELQGFISDRYKKDQILNEAGVVKMRCGHYFSRTVMQGVIDFQINKQKQHFFNCPNLKEGKEGKVLCRQPFTKQDCQLIAGYSKDEWKQIQAKLRQNQVKLRQNQKNSKPS